MVGLQRLPGKRDRPLVGNTRVDQLSLEPELISELHDRIDRGCVRSARLVVQRHRPFKLNACLAVRALGLQCRPERLKCLRSLPIRDLLGLFQGDASPEHDQRLVLAAGAIEHTTEAVERSDQVGRCDTRTCLRERHASLEDSNGIRITAGDEKDLSQVHE